MRARTNAATETATAAEAYFKVTSVKLKVKGWEMLGLGLAAVGFCL